MDLDTVVLGFAVGAVVAVVGGHGIVVGSSRGAMDERRDVRRGGGGD